MGTQKPRTKRATVETARRITAREAAHVTGAQTVRAQVANSAALRLWCVCGSCQKRTVYLYDAAHDPRQAASTWLCRHCARLVYARQQQRGTRAAFEQWLTPERAERMGRGHPAYVALWRWLDREHARAAALDWDKATPEQREQLRARFGSELSARAEHRRAVQDFADELSERDLEAQRQVLADLWKFWKSENRSQPKPHPKPQQRQQPREVEAEGAARNWEPPEILGS